MSLRINHYGDIVGPGSPSHSYSEPMLRSMDYVPPPLTSEEERQLDLAREMLLSAQYPPPTSEQRLAEKLMHEARATEFWRRQREASHKLEHWLKQLRGGAK